MRNHTPAIANEPTTNSVVMTWKVADEITTYPQNIHDHTNSIALESIRVEGLLEAKVAGRQA